MGHLRQETALRLGCDLKFMDRLHLLRHVDKDAHIAKDLVKAVPHAIDADGISVRLCLIPKPRGIDLILGAFKHLLRGSLRQQKKGIQCMPSFFAVRYSFIRVTIKKSRPSREIEHDNSRIDEIKDLILEAAHPDIKGRKPGCTVPHHDSAGSGTDT